MYNYTNNDFKVEKRKSEGAFSEIDKLETRPIIPPHTHPTHHHHHHHHLSPSLSNPDYMCHTFPGSKN
jgi:hypothetical protein